MSYLPTTQLNPFFSAYRNSSQTVTFPADFVANQFLNCTESSTTGRVQLDQNGFVICETRSTSGNLFFSIKAAGTDALSEGYQVRSNAKGTYMIDDAAYGFASSSASVGASTANSYPTQVSVASDEVRVMGIRTL